MSNINSLQPLVELDYPEFYNHKFINKRLFPNARAFAFSNISGLEWYNQFEIIVRDAIIMKKFLPIYRMGDGEYSFFLGKSYIQLLPPWKLSWKQNIFKFLHLFKTNHSSGSIIDGLEEYTKREKSFLRNIYVDQLKQISREGILAMGLDSEGIYEKYVPLILRGFDEEEIILNERNYFHVYHVYAMFSSSFQEFLYNDRNVLVITSLNAEKEDGIRKYLSRKMVRRLDFYSISPNKSMLEVIDLEKIEKDLDLVIIAAGIGSANIICQLKSLSIPCIDIGTLLGNMLNPERVFERPYMTCDANFQLEKIKFLTESQKVLLSKNRI